MSLLNALGADYAPSIALRKGPGCPAVVVHLVGRLTEAVFAFLCPATDALASCGALQVLVVIDDAASRGRVPRLHRSVEVLLARDHANPLKRWRHVYRIVNAVLRREPSAAVHLHGFWPGLLATTLARRARGAGAPLFFSARSEARRLAELIGALPQQVENPVDDAFFEVMHHEARRPLLFCGGCAESGSSVELFTRLAVELGDSELDLSFNWIGDLEPAEKNHLEAANVGLYLNGEEDERASLLAAGWIYVAVDGGRAFPAPLAEAMAAGVACVALDTPAHRELIEDGRTGILCKHQHELLVRIAELIDTPQLRGALGRAARLEAARRFSREAFSRKLMAAYEGGGECRSARRVLIRH